MRYAGLVNRSPGAALRGATRRGVLRTDDPQPFAVIVARLYRKDWVVYCKRPFGGPEQVIRYLGQYTHRIALSNHRLVAIDERGVTFRTKNGQAVTLNGQTFLTRWLGQVLPPRFVRSATTASCRQRMRQPGSNSHDSSR